MQTCKSRTWWEHIFQFPQKNHERGRDNLSIHNEVYAEEQNQTMNVYIFEYAPCLN